MALLWAMIAVVMVALLAVAATLLTSGETLINENFSMGDQASYVADEALSQFYANFRPSDNLNSPVITSIEVDTATDGSGEVDTTDVFGDYSGADLKVSDLTFDSAWVRVTPTKLLGSQHGDVYMLEAEATIADPRQSRPLTVRWLRTYAELVPPIYIRGALNSPNGISGLSTGNRLTLNGGKKGKCGSGNSIPSLATPAGSYSFKNKKTKIQTDSAGIGIDSTTASYQELKDSLHVDWAQLTSDGTYAAAPLSIVIPRDYPTLDAVPWKTFKKSSIWPDVLVHGDVTITDDIHGFGMLVVDGALNITHGVLSWNGLILTGKQLTITDAPAKAHLHAHGAVATGLNCSVAEIAAGTCKDVLAGEHLGVDYALCDVESAWTGLLGLRPLTPSRHSPFF